MKVIYSLTLLMALFFLSACAPVLPVTGGAAPTVTLVNTIAMPTNTPINMTPLAPSATAASATATSAAVTATPALASTMTMPLPTTPSTPQPAATASSAPAAGTQEVTIANFAFSPAALTVTAGTKVTWTNKDPTAHTVTADDRSFDSGPVNPGAKFSFTFNQPGTFSYHCSIHPSMVAKVIVNASGASAPAAGSATAATSQPKPSGSNVGVIHISIANFAFSPARLTVPMGTKVRWTNMDSTAHTVTANSGTFDSGPINPGATFAVDFSQPGTYTYHCKIHPNMVGTIIVTGPGTTTSGSGSHSSGSGGSGSGGGMGGSGGGGGYHQ